MLDVIWLNLVEMSKIDEFSILLEKVIDSEKDWKTWCDTEAPEEVSADISLHCDLMVSEDRRRYPAATRTRWTSSGSCC